MTATADDATARGAHLELIEDLRTRLARVHAGGGERARERHLARGKLLARDRIARLCDPGTPVLETDGTLSVVPVRAWPSIRAQPSVPSRRDA